MLSQDNDQDCKPVLSLKDDCMSTNYDFLSIFTVMLLFLTLTLCH